MYHTHTTFFAHYPSHTSYTNLSQSITISTEMVRKAATQIQPDRDELYREGQSLNVPRYFHGCVSIDGTALVFGGHGDAGILDSIEVRNKTTETWILLDRRLPKMMAGFAAYALKDPIARKYQVNGLFFVVDFQIFCSNISFGQRSP